ncbi:MAG TPA: glycoside hydrolase family 2 TIM barrel-domain containing protein [Phnomibacter sp.]|nr:glycoside hydrolase family 2 TIM barrel-domain containing protein [Phnomibacter sp.]
MVRKYQHIIFVPLLWLQLSHIVVAQTAMINVQARALTDLNGNWNVIIDPTGIGNWRQVWMEHQPQKETDFFEYSFDGGPQLKVPADFNSQMPELTFYEGTVWYRKQFNYSIKPGKRVFLHFGAVNYMADVYVNKTLIGSHEGGFTPFQFELTDKIKDGLNTIVVKVNNNRLHNGIPGLGYDWLNYGGITREVNFIETNATFIEDYHIQLSKGSVSRVTGWVKLNGAAQQQPVSVTIPELKLKYKAITNEEGLAKVDFSAAFKLWWPHNPKRYQVIIETVADRVTDSIGFRSIEVKGNNLLLNGKSIFLKAVNIHEENPAKAARAWSKEDAQVLLNAAKELGCNMVRLAHYPHNENMVEEAEKMGLMVWSELPVYQHIAFADNAVPHKMELMLKEMMRRDRNRCAVVVWSLSNETYQETPNRNTALIKFSQQCRAIDSTRLITHVVNTQHYNNNAFYVWDTLHHYSDFIALNEYIGWYVPWQGKPQDVIWKLEYPNKPVFISEFGGEAVYGNHHGPVDEAAYWTEDYLENIYINQVKMFGTIPHLAGVCPWLLFDYRSTGRMHPVYQQRYNRKGLLSDKGEKKKAWYIIKAYYDNK